MMMDGKLFREVDDRLWSFERRKKDCEQNQVTVQVLSTVPVMFNYWAKPEHGADIARYLNDQIAEQISANPKRYVGLGTLPMQDASFAITEIERCMHQLKFAGFEIGTNING